jgi:transposase
MRMGGLRHPSPPGAPRRLAAEPRAPRPARPQRGAEASGRRGDVWPHARIAAVSQLALGRSDHPRHVGRWCRAIRWSPPKPAPRARRRDEAVSPRWRERTWPARNGGHKPKGARPSSALHLASPPYRVSSAPMLQQDRLLCARSGRPGLLSALRAIAPQGKRCCPYQGRTFNAAEGASWWAHRAARGARPCADLRGWGCDAPPSAHHRVPGPWRHAPSPSRPAPRLCPSAESRRRALGPPNRGRAAACLRLAPPPLRRELRDAGQRARRKPRLLQGFVRGANL